MAQKVPAKLARDMLVRPWIYLPLFQKEDYLSRVPEHYKKFYWEWKSVTPSPVHYIPTPGKFEKMPNGDIHPVQNFPLPLKYPRELHQGLWGGEAIIKGFQKRQRLKRRVPHYWVPTLKSSVVYSEILDRFMEMTVTERTLTLIDQHYGLDTYILETPSADLMSHLALKLKREMLLSLVRETLYPEDPFKKEEVLKKYKKYIISEEEADWYGLSLMEAKNKQMRLEEVANRPQPLKHKFRAQFVEHLKVKQLEEKEEMIKEKGSSFPSDWLSRVNPFAKKQDD